MAIIEESSEPAMVQPNKDIEISDTDSERTMSLEEDEKMFEDDHDLSKNKPTTEFVSYSPRATRVTFAPRAKLYRTISRGEYTQEEIEKAFWTPKQFRGLNIARKRTIKRLEAGVEAKSSATYRGLEKCTIWGYRHCFKAKNAYVNTVMEEMERKNKNESWDWEKIASRTETTTKQSVREAIKIALSDEKEARAAYEPIGVKDDLVQKQQQQKMGKLVSFFRLVRSR